MYVQDTEWAMAIVIARLNTEASPKQVASAIRMATYVMYEYDSAPRSRFENNVASYLPRGTEVGAELAALRAAERAKEEEYG